MPQRDTGPPGAPAAGAGPRQHCKVRQKPQEPVALLTEGRKQLRKAKRLEHKGKRPRECEAEKQGTWDFLQSCGWIHEIDDAPVYYPTREEFADPIAYIRKIQPEAAKAGICRIVPPVTAMLSGAWAVAPLSSAARAAGGKLTFTAREQQLGGVQWTSFDSGRFRQGIKRYRLEEFEKQAHRMARRHFGTAATLPPRVVEAEYWRAHASLQGQEFVQYGNDVEGSAFSDHPSDPLGSSAWNLKVLPRLPGSCLRLLGCDVPGVTEPMLYFGMLFATFAWHVEDHYLYSINYHHWGAPKTWYGVPASNADAFESLVESQVYSRAAAAAAARGCSPREVQDAALRALFCKTTMFSPELLMRAGVRVVRAVQQPGDFVVTFPRAYHGGFNTGFNCGEAVNFATADWLPYGAECCARYRRLQCSHILAHEQLLVSEAMVALAELGGAPVEAAPSGPDGAAPGAAPAAPRGAAADSTAAAAAAAEAQPQLPLQLGDGTATLLRSFVRLMQWQHAARAQLAAAGAHAQLAAVPLGRSLCACASCLEPSCLAVVLQARPAPAVMRCLRCAAARLTATADGAGAGAHDAAGGADTGAAGGSGGDAGDNCGEGGVGSGGRRASDAHRGGGGSADGGEARGSGERSCGSAASSSCAGQGLVVLYRADIKKLEGLARYAQQLLGSCASSSARGAETALGDEGLTECRFGTDPALGSGGALAPGFEWQDVPGMRDERAAAPGGMAGEEGGAGDWLQLLVDDQGWEPGAAAAAEAEAREAPAVPAAPAAAAEAPAAAATAAETAAAAASDGAGRQLSPTKRARTVALALTGGCAVVREEGGIGGQASLPPKRGRRSPGWSSPGGTPSFTSGAAADAVGAASCGMRRQARFERRQEALEGLQKQQERLQQVQLHPAKRQRFAQERRQQVQRCGEGKGPQKAQEDAGRMQECAGRAGRRALRRAQVAASAGRGRRPVQQGAASGSAGGVQEGAQERQGVASGGAGGEQEGAQEGAQEGVQEGAQEGAQEQQLGREVKEEPQAIGPQRVDAAGSQQVQPRTGAPAGGCGCTHPVRGAGGAAAAPCGDCGSGAQTAAGARQSPAGVWAAAQAQLPLDLEPPQALGGAAATAQATLVDSDPSASGHASAAGAPSRAGGSPAAATPVAPGSPGAAGARGRGRRGAAARRLLRHVPRTCRAAAPTRPGGQPKRGVADTGGRARAAPNDAGSCPADAYAESPAAPGTPPAQAAAAAPAPAAPPSVVPSPAAAASGADACAAVSRQGSGGGPQAVLAPAVAASVTDEAQGVAEGVSPRPAVNVDGRPAPMAAAPWAGAGGAGGPEAQAAAGAHAQEAAPGAAARPAPAAPTTARAVEVPPAPPALTARPPAVRAPHPAPPRAAPPPAGAQRPDPGAQCINTPDTPLTLLEQGTVTLRSGAGNGGCSSNDGGGGSSGGGGDGAPASSLPHLVLRRILALPGPLRSQARGGGGGGLPLLHPERCYLLPEDVAAAILGLRLPQRCPQAAAAHLLSRCHAKVCALAGLAQQAPPPPPPMAYVLSGAGVVVCPVLDLGGVGMLLSVLEAPDAQRLAAFVEGLWPELDKCAKQMVSWKLGRRRLQPGAPQVEGGQEPQALAAGQQGQQLGQVRDVSTLPPPPAEQPLQLQAAASTAQQARAVSSRTASPLLLSAAACDATPQPASPGERVSAAPNLPHPQQPPAAAAGQQVALTAA